MSGSDTSGRDRVLIERRERVALLTLNAPEKRNAIDLAMVQGLHAALDELHEFTVVLLGLAREAGDQRRPDRQARDPIAELLQQLLLVGA